jgi:hypothetical protein
MIFCQVINLLPFSKRTMNEDNLDHLNIRQYYGRELARVGDITNKKAVENNWNFEEIAHLTCCASVGLTTGLAVFCVCQFLHREFIRNE